MIWGVNLFINWALIKFAEGSIKANGVDIRDIHLNDLRDIITVVPQDVYLFNRSIIENLKLAKSSATNEELVKALIKSNSIGFVNNLDGGLNTLVGERGTRLSGGEKLRISIAQAFLKDSPVLILGDIKANLDYNNEKLINNAMHIL